MSTAPSGNGEPPSCPGCGGPLEMVISDDGTRHYSCSSCGGLMCGEAVLRTIAGDTRAQHCWGSAYFSETAADGRCPFCGQTMRCGSVEHGRVWACKADGMVFLDKAALASFAATPAGAAAAPAQTGPVRCPNCGAPVLRSSDPNCEFCGASLGVPHAEPQVVVLEHDAPAEPQTLTGRVLRTVADVVDDVSEERRRRW